MLNPMPQLGCDAHDPTYVERINVHRSLCPNGALGWWWVPISEAGEVDEYRSALQCLNAWEDKMWWMPRG